MSRFYTFCRLYGDNILVRGWDDKLGGHFKEKVPFKPTLFVPTNKKTKYRTLDGLPVAPIKPGTMKECKAFIEQYSNVSGTNVYGMERWIYQFIAEQYPGEIEYDIDKIKMWSLDIETTAENGFPKPAEAAEEILLITLKNFKTKRLITFGSRPYTPTRDDVEYVYCEDEITLLNTFIAWWRDVEPEVITGWNVELFDNAYICNRIRNVLGVNAMRSLSPWMMVSENYVEVYGRREPKFDIAGVAVIDYLDIYKKFTFTNRESYRLDVIAEIELGQKKLDHSEFETFRDFYTHGWTKFVDYNLVDVDLVDQLEEKMKLIDLVMLMAYDAKCNYIDTFAQVRLWDIIIYNYLREKDIVLPLLQKRDKPDQFIGAYVKEPIPGGYDWVVSLDLNSLYPSLIRFLNISPETLLKGKVDVDLEGLINKECDISTDEDVCIAAEQLTAKKWCHVHAERVGYKRNVEVSAAVIMPKELPVINHPKDVC